MSVKSLYRACDQTFVSVAAFDFHQTGNYGEPIYAGNLLHVVGYPLHQRRCLSVEETLALGMTQNVKGWWHMSVRVKAVAGLCQGRSVRKRRRKKRTKER